jgi:hypothetical protein
VEALHFRKLFQRQDTKGNRMSRHTKEEFYVEAGKIAALITMIPDTMFVKGPVQERHVHLEMAMSNLIAAREALEAAERTVNG